jgi:hypothetical protein
MTQLLDFPDEVLCKIFEYLSPFDALYSFINLNHRFNCLLMPFKHQIDLTYLSYEQFMYYMNHLLPILNKDEPLNVMKLGNKRTPGQIKLFNTLMNDEHYRNYFNNIDKVLLESPRFEEFIEFVEKFLLSLSGLLTLSIKIDYIRDKDFQGLAQLIINSILSIPTLIKLKLSIEMSSGLVLSRLSNTHMFHSLIYVDLNLSLVTDLLILIQRIPNVETLFICISWWTSGDQTIVKMLDQMRSNTNHQSFLNQLKKFRLTINSIITFQFEHLEQILYRIINTRITSSFSLILHNSLMINDQSIKLIDGQQWERLLGFYPLLIQFNLFIRISRSGQNEEDLIKSNSFNSKYFQDKKWFFSYLKYSIKNDLILYSIPYRNKDLFDILINDDIILNQFPMNYTPNLSIDHKNNTEYQLTFDFILEHFPSLQELTLNHININSRAINSLDIPSLHTLKIEKEQNINLSNLFRLFPLINTLFLSYFNLDDQYTSLK